MTYEDDASASAAVNQFNGKKLRATQVNPDGKNGAAETEWDYNYTHYATLCNHVIRLNISGTEFMGQRVEVSIFGQRPLTATRGRGSTSGGRGRGN